jgi:hypothetical protein
MGSLIVYRILAALIPAVFVGEVAAQQVDPAAIAKVNREVLTPEEQLELQALLHEAAKRRTAVSARKEEGTDAEPAGQDIT